LLQQCFCFAAHAVSISYRQNLSTAHDVRFE
jgi:hypothetical protein